MHQSLQAASAVSSPLASRHSCARQGAVAPASWPLRRSTPRAPRSAGARASVGAFAAAAPSDGGATVAWLAGQAVAAAAVVGAFLAYESKAAAQSRVDAEVRPQRAAARACHPPPLTRHRRRRARCAAARG
jgi:hypothetical protein